MGCGNPTAVADLREGERVLDLGSGGGIDVLLSVRRVGPTGRAFGLDMTDEMLARAEQRAQEAGAETVEFLKGMIEAIPLPASSVDVVISNCVINLAADKKAVFRQIDEYLKPEAVWGVTDIVADDGLMPNNGRGKGRMPAGLRVRFVFAEFKDGLIEVGLTDVSITPTHAVVPGCTATSSRQLSLRHASCSQASR